VFIALKVDDAFVRPYLGDVLAVVLVYLALRATTSLGVWSAAGLAFGLGVVIEAAQLFGLLDRLGLDDNRLARTVLGGVFDLKDLACYAAGAGLVLATEALRRSSATDPS
jgi:hypothetical protein